MRLVLTPVLAFLIATMAYSGGAATDAATTEQDWAALALPPETFSDILPVAPGPYTGPSSVAVPTGWKSWTDDVHKQCGDLKLVFLNPDLQEDDNGVIQASNRFFIQFQAVGTGADEITRFSFSFGKTLKEINDNPEITCREDLPNSQLGKGTGGAYLLFYRSDFNADDGFFVPIETMNVPDGDYAAAVHAYTGNGLTGYTEVARAWAMATVKNCDGPSIPNACVQGGVEEQQKNDKTMPWPMVLPGDGEQTNDVSGLTVEVMEFLGTGGTPEEISQSAIDAGRIKAWLNQEPLQLTAWEPPERDRDLVPLNDDTACPTTVRSACEKVVYSTGAKWEGTIQCNDIIKVETTDLNGNVATKQIHNCRTFGGASTADYPILDYKVVGADRLDLEAGKEGRFNMRIENVGGGEAHVNLLLEYNDTFMEAHWQNVESEHTHAPGSAPAGETHVEIQPGTATKLDVIVQPKPDAPKGSYPIRAGLEYLEAGEQRLVWRDLSVDVISAIAPTNTTNVTEDKPPVKEDTPAPGAALLVATGLLAAVYVARRRRA